MRQYLKDVAALDEPQQLREVQPHHLVGGHPPEQLIGGSQLPAERDRVQRAEDPVESGSRHHGLCAGRPQVGLPDLGAGEDSQIRVAPTALLHAREIAGDVEHMHPGVRARIDVLRRDPVGLGSSGEVQMIGEGHRGNPCGQGLLAAAHHRRLGLRVPRPFGVHVVVRRQHAAHSVMAPRGLIPAGLRRYQVWWLRLGGHQPG